MKKAEIELSMRTIVLLVLFIVILVVVVVLGSMIAFDSTAGIENMTNIAEGFAP